jgi:cyclohexyl-isocyanide hydratase
MTMTLEVGFLLFPQIQQLDLTGPYEVLASLPGVRPHLIWKKLEPVTASTGLVLMPTIDFATCPPLDIFCVPGGLGINPLLEDAETIAFVQKQAATARYVTSVCTGALVLGVAGLLRGKKATTHWNARDLLGAFGAVLTDGRVVQDGNLITAGGVTAGIDFGLAIVAEIAGRQEAETIQLGLEYRPAPPFDAGGPETASAPVLASAKARGAASRKAREEIIARIGGSAA